MPSKKNINTKTSKTNSKGNKRLFPKVSLAKALEIAQKIKDLNGGNPWTPAEIADALQMGPKAPDFYYLTAASRDYGLTNGTSSKQSTGSKPVIELTAFGRELVYAPDPNIERQKKIEAFHKIDLFSKVLKHYKSANLPEMKYLGNTLEREFNLPREQHEEFSRLFRENCRYLGITSGEISLPNDSGGAPSTVIVGEPPTKSTLKAFIIMPFVEKTPDRPKGFFLEVLRSLITPAALDAGFRVETANRQGSDIIQSTIINELLDADLVIADLTDHNPNVLFELGVRMASDKPVALIKAAGTGRVFDVDNLLRVHEYQPNLWRSTTETDLPELTKHIKATWGSRNKEKSYMKILRRPEPQPNEVD